MSKILKPSRLDLDHNAPNASKEWKHWRKTFENFIAECGEDAPDKFRSIINCVSASVYEYVEDCTTYDEVINTLVGLYVKTPNETFVRHQLLARHQNPNESLDSFLQELRKLSKNCNYTNVTAAQYREEQIRDAFISGISSNYIRQRLLENPVLDLQTAFDKARALDIAQNNFEEYNPTNSQLPSNGVALADTEEINPDNETTAAAVSSYMHTKCQFCGNSAHNRKNCPARNVTCHNCGKNGHFSKVCRSVIH